MNQDDAWKRKERHGREFEKENNKRLRALEAKVFEIIIGELRKQLTLSGDTVEQTLSNLSMNNALNSAFRDIDKEHSKVMNRFVRELLKGSRHSRAYFKLLEPSEKRFERAEKKALSQMLRAIGLRFDDQGNALPTRGGFVSTILEDNFLKKQVQAEVYQAVLGGTGFEDLSRRLRSIVHGAPGRTGSFVRYYNLYAYDFVQQVDRVELDTYAKELKLQAFVYAGTEIAKTRHFCEERIGKVFLRSEAKKWKKLRWQGKPKSGYDPLKDMGGYNCRHIPRFISNRKAVEMRDDLYIDENGNLKKR